MEEQRRGAAGVGGSALVGPGLLAAAAAAATPVGGLVYSDTSVSSPVGGFVCAKLLFPLILRPPVAAWAAPVLSCLVAASTFASPSGICVALLIPMPLVS